MILKQNLDVVLPKYIETINFAFHFLKQINLVPRAHVPFGQHQDTELWNNQFPETKISGLPVSRRMRGLVYMASRDVDTFHKGIQYALEQLGKSKFGFERTAVSNFKSKRHEGSGNVLVDALFLARLVDTLVDYNGKQDKRNLVKT